MKPSNTMTKELTSQPENNSLPKEEWVLDLKQLDTRVGPEYEVGETLDKSPKWFTFNAPFKFGDTPEETKEMEQMKQEQLKMGILKRAKTAIDTNVSIPRISEQMAAFNPDVQRLQGLINESPERAAQSAIVNKINKNNLPKVKDNKTGKVRKLKPNDKCLCGSGKKFKKCHGRGVF